MRQRWRLPSCKPRRSAVRIAAQAHLYKPVKRSPASVSPVSSPQARTRCFVWNLHSHVFGVGLSLSYRRVWNFRHNEDSASSPPSRAHSPPVLGPLVSLLHHRRHQRRGAVAQHLRHPHRRLLIPQLRPQLLLQGMTSGAMGNGWKLHGTEPPPCPVAPADAPLQGRYDVGAVPAIGVHSEGRTARLPANN